MRHPHSERATCRRGKRLAAVLALALVPAVLATGSAPPAVAGGMLEQVSPDFKIGIDQATVLRLEGNAAALAIGNPSIADAIVQSPDTLLLTGRSYGATNLLVFDAEGNEIVSLIVNVVDAAPRLVTVHRGAAQSSYNCAPDCQPVLRIGDEAEFHSRISGQTSGKAGLAQSGGAGQ